MKDFFELLVKDYGFPPFIASNIMLIFYSAGILIGVYKTIKFVIGRIRRNNISKIVDKDLHPYFTQSEIYNYTKLYIPQYFQNITPSEGEEPGKIHAAAARSKLMKEFLKKGLLTKSPIKYFIILSDTGMGKTAFLINLYLKYKSSRVKLNHVKYDIYLFPLGAKDCLQKIISLNNKNNTILLLDAFDEDIKAVNDYKNRMIEILDNVKEFRKVIFTCRTQFFPSKDEEPKDTNDITFGENIKHTIHKLYLSAFDDFDILKYLLKKYGLNLIKLYHAYRLVKKSPSLMFRPMLLAYIDDLIKKIFYTYTFQMYEVLIENWIKRESLKPAIIENKANDRYSNDLLKFSRDLAINLYTLRESRGGYFISIEELKKMSENKMFNTHSLTIEDKTGRSLLNRNSIGQYKFSHKSILEYFLAIEVLNNPPFLSDFDFHGMDATLNFHTEMLTMVLTSFDGLYYLNNDNKVKILSSLLPSQLKKIDKVIIKNIANNNVNFLAGLSHIKTLVITDKSFLIIYLIYLFICIKKRLTTDTMLSAFSTYTNNYESVISQVMVLRPQIDYECIRILISNCEIDETISRQFFKLLDTFRVTQPVSSDEILELRDLRDYLRKGVSENVLIQDAIINIKRINALSSFMPQVKVFY